ncbi:SPOR domain-containing protein [Capnocytophaga leadbetteri]|jgi:hypothetical protein|uniref:HU domain-containing protein n=1 Tax=Capnocytophaga leadbetteri TaxID=327575 RepID=UPI0028E9A487|nr:SPOR domain-containing protein [Capnocytophaga leadbetteri]
MKDLNVYIEELLYKHQCVIVPKFGAFISNRKSATLGDDKTFDPPKRELTFNPSLNSNDGLLVKYVSEESGIDYNLVEDYVNLAVEGWKRILQQDQPLVLDKIGTFRQMGEGRISFAPADEVNFLTDSFGMTPFIPHEVPSSDLKIAENQIKPTLNTSHTLPPEEELPPAIESPISQVTPVVPIQTETPKKGKKEKDLKEKKSFKLRPYIKYSAVAAVGLIILAYGAYRLFNEKVVADGTTDNQFVVTDSLVQERLNQKLSEAGIFTPPITMPTVALQAEKVKAKDNKPEKDKVEITNSKPEKDKKSNGGEVATTPASTQTGGSNAGGGTSSGKKSNAVLAAKKYQVIAGSFKEEKNAQARAKQLQKLGYKNAYVLGLNAKGLYQVSYGGFDSMDEAKLMQKEIKEAKEEKKLDGGWILTQ